jgi:EmrB/QacA subfamily drug resistance transporter
VSQVAAAARVASAGRSLGLIVLLAGGFMPPADFFIVNVTLPSIHQSLGASGAEVQLVISGYAAGFAVFLVTGGRLGDLFGRRRMFILGMVGFTLGNLICGVAPTPTSLVIGRILQGITAAAVTPNVLGSIRALYDNERELSRAMSAYGVMMGLAAAAGQVGGGLLVAWNPWDLGWRAVFLLKLPVCIAVAVAAWFVLPETSGSGRQRLDLGGSALLSLALAALILPLSEGRQQGWPLWTFALLAASAPLLAWFLRCEAALARQGGQPLFDVRLFRVGSFRRGALVATLFYFTSPFYLLFGIYQQEGRGSDPLMSGLAFLPYGIGLFIGPPISAPLVARHRSLLLTVGMMIQVVGYALIGIAVARGASEAVVLATVFIAGFGQGVALPRLFNSAMGDVPAEQAGVAAGVISSLLQIGAAVSVAAIGSLFFAVLGRATGEPAYAHAFAIAMIAVVGALALAMCATMLRR